MGTTSAARARLPLYPPRTKEAQTCLRHILLRAQISPRSIVVKETLYDDDSRDEPDLGTTAQ